MFGSVKYLYLNISEILELICSPIFSSSEKKYVSNQHRRPWPHLAASGRTGWTVAALCGHWPHGVAAGRTVRLHGASGMIPNHYRCISTLVAASASITCAAKKSVMKSLHERT